VTDVGRAAMERGCAGGGGTSASATSALAGHVGVGGGGGGSGGGGGALDILEKCLKKGLQDAGGPVRETSREVFEIYTKYWPVRANRCVLCVEKNASSCFYVAL
jgi:hypothetical protein